MLAMKDVRSTFFQLSMIALAPLVLGTFGVSAMGQEEPAADTKKFQVIGMPEDWSHHHLVFSNPGTEEEAIRNGTHDKWLKTVNDPRYVIQQLKRKAPVQKPAAEDAGRIEVIARDPEMAPETEEVQPDWTAIKRPEWSIFPEKTGLKQDWSEGLTTASSMPNTYPAKWSFSTTGTPSCANDFAVYPTGATGSASAATIVAYNNLYAGSGTISASGPCEGAGGNPTVYWAYNTGAAAVTTSPVFSFYGTQMAFIQSNGTTASLVLLKGSATGGAFTGNTTLNSKNVTVSSCTSALAGEPIYGPGIPAGDTITSCSGTALVLNTAANASGTTQPLSFNNQFTGGTTASSKSVTGLPSGGCTAATAGSPIYGSGIPPGDTISSCTNTTITLTTAATATGSATITFNPATLAAPVTLTTNTSANYPSCVAPCMYVVALSGSPNDTYSSPFYDYTNDALYVGDNSSYLHQFTGVFNGTPTESTKVQLNATPYYVASPVYDTTSGCVFVGDSEGYLYSVDPATPGGSVCMGSTFAKFATSEVMGDTFDTNPGIFDGPLVDSNAGMVYAFVAYGSSTTHSHDNEIVQFKTSFSGTSATPNATEALGAGLSSINLYAGSFDNVYYESTSSSSPSGNIYVVGNVNGTQGELYRVPIASNAMSTPVQLFAVGDASYYPWASPVTEFCANGPSACVSNGTSTTTGTDTIYFSVYASPVAGSGACSESSGSGCILAYNVNSALTTTSTPSGSLSISATTMNGCWTTGAFIVDNAIANTGATGTSQVYFLNLNGNAPSTAISSDCNTGTGKTTQAVQVDQSTL
jgi:hypothetical protein